MKNISKKKISPRTLALLPAILTALTVLSTTHSHAPEFFPITHQRAGYFIIETTTPDYPETGARGYLYVKGNDSFIGTCHVIDTHGKEYLCKIESIAPQHHPRRLHRVSFDIIDTIEPSPRKPGPTPVIKKTITLGSQRLIFNSLPNEKKRFLSNSPIPLRVVKPLDLSGIKKILYNIEEVTGHSYSADLLDVHQVRQWGLSTSINFAHKDNIYLGTVDGNLCMIFEENGILKHTGISPATLEKFKDFIYFYITITKKVNAQ